MGLTEQALDDLVRRVILDAARREYGGVIAERPEHGFSLLFEKRMRKLLRRARHPVRRRVVQWAACLLLAAILGGCTVLAVSPEARAALAGWIRELRQEWFSYRYTGEAREAPGNTVYAPSWLPDGYREVTAPEPGAFVHGLYEGEDGALLSFAYQAGVKGVTFHVEWEGMERQPAMVSGEEADFYQNAAEGMNVLVWTDAPQDAVFWLAGPLSKAELVRVAESLRESAPLDWVYRPTWLPGAGAVVSSSELHGEGTTVYVIGEGTEITFCYSKSGVTPYEERRDGRRIALENGPATLYPPEEDGADPVLTWMDSATGYALWLISSMPEEDMVTFAENVTIYVHNISSALEEAPFGDALITGPPCEKVEQALTDAFVSSVQEYAKRDAQAGIYMQSDYIAMETAYMEAHISPEREAAIAQVSGLMEQYTGADQPTGDHILCRIEPFYFASIHIGYGGTTAQIYDIYGHMIAGYNSAGAPWFSLPTLEEAQFGYAAGQIYREAYREAEASLP